MEKYKKMIAGIGLSLALGCAVGGVLIKNASSTAQADGVDALLRTTYELGETLSVPVGEIEYDGKMLTADTHVIYCPDGSVKYGDRLTIDDYGLYTVRYMTTLDGKKLYADKKFSVKQGICSYENKNSGYYYGKNEAYDTKNGLNLSIKQGDEMRINKIVDLSDSTLSNPFIDVRFTPAKYGMADAYKVYMKLTDAYDEDNYVVIRMQNWSDFGAWADGSCYMDVAANGQDWTSAVTKENNYHKRGENGKGWHLSFTSMTGRDSNGNEANNSLKIAYDNTTKQFDTNSKNYGGCLADLDDPYWYDLSWEPLWNGFTTGECYVSFYGERYNAGSLNLHIIRLKDQALNFADADENAPEITVNGGKTEDLPYAVVNREYRIFEASGRDLADGTVEVKANVYYDFAGNRCLIDSRDGVFTPKKAGIYTIVYCAVDKTGNTKYETVDVECKEVANNLSVKLDGVVSSAKTGEKVRLFDALSIVDANGESDCEGVIVGGGEEFSVNIQEPFFTPMKAGEYTLKLTVKDYVLTQEKSYTINVAENDKAVFTADANVPKYFILGAKYLLPSLRADIWQNGTLQNADAELYVSVNGGARIKINDGIYCPDTKGTVDVLYVANKNGSETVKTYSVPVIDVGYNSKLSVDKYFYDADGVVSSAVTDDYLELTTTKDGDIDFINVAQSQKFEMRMNVNRDYQNFNRFYVLLTDAANPDVQVKVTYEKASEGILFYLNENYSVSKRLNAKFDESTADNVLCNYNNDERRVFASNQINYEIKRCLNGKEFNGFSGKVYVTVGFEGVTGEARVKVYAINKQTLWNFQKDTVVPQILPTVAIGQVAQGTVVRITPALFMDVLNPDITAKFWVTDNDGNYVRALDGTLLKEGECDVTKTYEIKADVYGDYLINYTCKDSKVARTASVMIGFSVVDLVAPEISFVNPTHSARVGDTVTVADVQIKDNHSQNCTVYYSYSDTEGRMYNLGVLSSEKPTFTVSEKGTYVVYCYVFDEANNSAFLSYEIVVC